MRLLHVFPVRASAELLKPEDSGLAHSYLLAYVQKHADFPVEFRMINQNIQGALEEYKPDIVAITAMTFNYDAAAKIASRAKQAGAMTIVGGHHLTNLPQHLTPDMDIGVLGEGEITYLEILDLYRQGRCEPQYLKEVAGLVFRNEDNELCITPPRPLIQDLDSIGHPLREAAPPSQSTCGTLLTSRGCPYRCVFCSQAQFWHSTVRFHSPEYVMEEIERVHRLSGTREIELHDGIFLINKKRLLSILDLWEKHPLYGRIGFSCWGRANLIDDEMAGLAVRMGVHTVKFGFESCNAESLTYLKGPSVTPEDNQRAYDILTKHKIRVHGSFVIASPNETREQIMDTYRFIKRNRLLSGAVYHLSPIPGTPLWDYELKRGLVSNDMDFTSLHGRIFDMETVYVSEKLQPEEIISLMKMFDDLWKKRRFYLRSRKFLSYLCTRPWVVPQKVWRDIRLLAKPRGKPREEAL